MFFSTGALDMAIPLVFFVITTVEKQVINSLLKRELFNIGSGFSHYSQPSHYRLPLICFLVSILWK